MQDFIYVPKFISLEYIFFPYLNLPSMCLFPALLGVVSSRLVQTQIPVWAMYISSATLLSATLMEQNYYERRNRPGTGDTPTLHPLPSSVIHMHVPPPHTHTPDLHPSALSRFLFFAPDSYIQIQVFLLCSNMGGFIKLGIWHTFKISQPINNVADAFVTNKCTFDKTVLTLFSFS